jgi:DNA mismatch repair ATPase MutS
MIGVADSIQRGSLGFASFSKGVDLSGNPLVIKDQFYPPLANESYVTNDATLEKNMVITGPNAAGKTTYLKTTMLNIIFTQQFGCGFYSACSMKPYTHIHSYLNIPDTSGRDSLFQAESRRCKEIIGDVLSSDAVDTRHFCIFDELYSGTNPAEATKSAYAFLVWLSQRENVDFILTTHYVDICGKFEKSNVRIANWKMDARETDEGDVEYTYKIVEGVSHIQGAIKVLRDMEYPAEIIDNIVGYEKEV